MSCDKEFEADASSRRIRCDECEKIERKLHNKLMYEQRRNKIQPSSFQS
ncbi:hypothetical protein [Anaerosporobacter sp.]